jgi:glyoxylase-like metal-dependent hydrolase (beta-lactamase superfamily II)
MVSGSAGLTVHSLSIPSTLPPITQIGDRIVQIRLPMTGNPMRYINGYLLEDDDGLTLIDCGWRGDDVLAALEQGLELSGHALGDIKRLLVTHFHFDHYGLAGTLVRAGVPELGMHARDWAFLVAREKRVADTDSVVNAWLVRNGLPVEPDPDEDEESFYDRYDFVEPTRLVEDGERIGRLRAMWTPGHSPGHLCFVDTISGRTFTGDHVLDPVTPHVGMWHESGRDAMGEYIGSLRAVGALETSGALPAHGEAFPDLARRVEELLAHEATRERDVLHALESGATTGAAVAAQLKWRRRGDRFDQLPPEHQQFAVAETLAHLEYLRARGEVIRKDTPAEITWAPANASVRA